MVNSDNLIFRIKEGYEKHIKTRPYLIALDGLSGAGKTTLVKQLKGILNNVVIIHIDDHIVEKSKRYGTGQEQWFEYYQLQWDTEYLKEQLFQKIQQNVQSLTLSFYQKEEDTHINKTINFSSNSIVIIEGIFLLRDEWRSFYDYIVYLDCPKEIRYERVLLRDTYIGDLVARLKKYKERYWVAEEYYLKKQQPFEQAHYIQKST
ncbi:kinase [Solibacillus sp. FSL R5-0691]|uniref:kinase n=1 Tax=Solibacillus sp. FSL R5-0691 TaxID=2921653 RepID=UPI0030D5B1E3